MKKLASPIKVDFETENSWETMVVTHASDRRWKQDYFRQSMLAVHEPCMPSDVVTPEEIMGGIHGAFRQNCHCEHDCCGHVFSHVQSVRPLSENRYLVVVTGGRNV